MHARAARHWLRQHAVRNDQRPGTHVNGATDRAESPKLLMCSHRSEPKASQRSGCAAKGLDVDLSLQQVGEQVGDPCFVPAGIPQTLDQDGTSGNLNVFCVLRPDESHPS